MNLEEINNLKGGEDLDVAVSKYVFGNTDEDLNNFKDLMIPPYSTCRAAAARVVCHLAFSKRFGKNFNSEIQREWRTQCATLKNEIITLNDAVFLMWATPDIICKAALRAVFNGGFGLFGPVAEDREDVMDYPVYMRPVNGGWC